MNKTLKKIIKMLEKKGIEYTVIELICNRQCISIEGDYWTIVDMFKRHKDIYVENRNRCTRTVWLYDKSDFEYLDDYCDRKTKLVETFCIAMHEGKDPKTAKAIQRQFAVENDSLHIFNDLYGIIEEKDFVKELKTA